MKNIKRFKKLVSVGLLALLLIACNASKSLTKKGNKLSEAGLHKDAVEYYIQALNKDKANVDARIGLRKSGGEVMAKYQTKFFKEYNNDDYKAAVYTYMETEKFQDRLNKYNAELSIPNHTTQDFKIAKDKYLEIEFQKANQLMAEEQFEQAEAVFHEIQRIDPTYGGGSLEQLKEIAQLEPPYRKGNDFLDQGKNRSAYWEFKKINDQNSSYKDAKFKLEEAKELAQFPIAILKFKNYSGQKGGGAQVQANLMDGLLKEKGPFVKVLDRTHMDELLNEQYLAMNGWVEGSGAVKTGQILGAKAILSGKLLSVRKETKSPVIKREKAYSRRSEKYYNAETQKTQTRFVYDKVFYNNYQGYTKVTVSFQYILVSAETGEILMSSIEEKELKSEVNYNTYQGGNTNNLYPGTWSRKLKDSPTDRVITNRNSVRNFQAGFKANKTLTPVNTLADDAFKSIGLSVAKKVYDFNPEN